MIRKAALVVLAALAVAPGCATYTAKMTDTGVLYYDGAYDLALGELDELVLKASEEDIYLYLLERGKVRLAAGEFDSAIVDLQAAERRFDDIEGVVSVGDAISSTIVSDASTEYIPDPHERILLNTYLVLAYLGADDIAGARVERNRVIRRLQDYLGTVTDEDLAPLDVPFARYVTAVMYENEGKLDDARIEYSKVEDLYPEAVPWSSNSHMTELVVLTELGRAPVKVSVAIRGYFEKRGGETYGYFTLPGDGGEMALPITSSLFSGKDVDYGRVFNFNFPEYVRMPRGAVYARPVIDGVEAGTAVTLDDLEDTAMEAFGRELPSILIRAAVRTYLQLFIQKELDDGAGEIAGVIAKIFTAAQTADTRSWQTLPSEVAVFRMEVEPGRHEVQMRYYDARGVMIDQSGILEVWVGEGKRKIAWMPGPP
jgi:tetratricopeptide (TPR) repeat protein